MRNLGNQLIFVILLLAGITYKSKAQDQEPAAYAVDATYNLHHTQKDSTSLVFVNMAYIREEPTAKSNLIDSIPLGTPVKFLDEDGLNATSIRGMYLPWYKIEYQLNNTKKTGYIWLGLLSIDSKIDPKSGNKFLYGYAWKSEDEYGNYYWVEAKALDKNKQLISSISFPYYPGEQSYSYSEIVENDGLPNTKFLYSIKFLGEACGIGSEDNMFAWNGQNFTALPKTVSVSDAGVYYYGEELVLPNQHKQGKDIILKLTEQGETEDYDEVESLEELEFTIIKTEETYQWNGTSYKKIGVKTIK